MATLFDTHHRVVPTWLAASTYLLQTDRREARNLVLEIDDPMTRTDTDRLVIQKVDAAIRARGALSVETVAGTIFPQGMYQRYGRPDFYKKFLKMMERAKKPGTWGTYAMRLFARRAGAQQINPMEIIIEKLKRAANEGNGYRAAYEAGLIDPVVDLDPAIDFGCELPTYDPGIDARKISNMPCLSHLSFKLVDHARVDLAAIYRSHYYCERALGNLIGLSRLQAFVAREAGLAPGVLTCLSTHARLDMRSWGGAAPTAALIQQCNAALCASLRI